MELDWLKKVWDQPVAERQSWIEPNESIALSRQCQLLNVTRSVVYEQKKRLRKEVDENELLLLRLLDEEYTRPPSPKAPTVSLWNTADEEILGRMWAHGQSQASSAVNAAVRTGWHVSRP